MSSRNWTAVRADYIAGATAPELARKYRIPLATIESRASRESWGGERKETASILQVELPARVAGGLAGLVASDAVMGREEVLRRLTSIARGGMRRVATWGAGGVVLRESEDLADEDSALVSEVGETVNAFGKAVRIKVLDPQAALRELARFHGLDTPADATDDGDGPPTRVVFQRAKRNA